MAKEKMDDLKKAKIIYSAELLVFVIIALVLGILFLLEIIPIKDWKKWLFTILTFLGGIWIIIDFIWTIKSKKRRAKNSLLDKSLVLPSGLILIILDIIALISLIKDSTWTGFNNVNFFRYEIGCALIYISIVFLVECIYHWFHPHPLLLNEDNELENEANKK